MPEFYDDEHKELDMLYGRLRELLAQLDRDGTPIRSVTPQLMATSTGDAANPEVTAALVVVQVKGTTAVEALRQLESAIRISALGEQDDTSENPETRVDVAITLPGEPELLTEEDLSQLEEATTLADVQQAAAEAETPSAEELH